MTVDTTRQACASLVALEEAATIGMSADDSAPAATSWKIRSGIRNAAKNGVELGRLEQLREHDQPDPAQDPRDEERAGHDQAGPGEPAGGGHGAGSRRARGCASR